MGAMAGILDFRWEKFSTSHPDTSNQILSRLAFWFRRRRSSKQIFKTVAMVAILDFLATFVFDLQVSWPFRSGVEVQTYLQDGGRGGYLGYPIIMILATFDLQVTPIHTTKFRVNWPFSSGVSSKLIFKMATSLDYRSK